MTETAPSPCTAWPRKLLDFLSSVRFTIALLVALAAILAFATVYESREGTSAVQVTVYRSGWFNVFLIAFTVNMLGGSYKRLRLRWSHLGFGITHLSVLVILLGAFLTRNFGIEGQMTIPEGETRDYFVGNEDFISVTLGDDRASLAVPIDRGSRRRQLALDSSSERGTFRVVADRYFPNLQFQQVVKPGGNTENPALEYRLEAMGSDSSGWLLSRVPGRETVDFGPMAVDFLEVPGEHPPEPATSATSANVLVLSSPDGKEVTEVPATAGTTAAVVISGKTYQVTIKQTFGNFTMAGQDFGDRPGAADNPAVAFTVDGPAGHASDLAFSKYPDFSLQHNKKATGYKARFLFRGGPVGGGDRLSIYWCAKSRLAYQMKRSGKIVDKGDLELGKPLDLMDGRLQFTVRSLLPKAQFASEAVNASEEAHNPAIHVRLVPSTGAPAETWLGWGDPHELEVAGKRATLGYRGERYAVPFSLKLLKFIEDKYPGSNQSATYQSKVLLTDREQSRNEEILISMNEPLLHRGYTFFQSSYIPGEAYTTVLSVSRDPGKWPTYIGYLLMTVGLILMFYFKSYLASWDRPRQPKETPR